MENARLIYIGDNWFHILDIQLKSPLLLSNKKKNHRLVKFLRDQISIEEIKIPIKLISEMIIYMI